MGHFGYLIVTFIILCLFPSHLKAETQFWVKIQLMGEFNSAPVCFSPGIVYTAHMALIDAAGNRLSIEPYGCIDIEADGNCGQSGSSYRIYSGWEIVEIRAQTPSYDERSEYDSHYGIPLWYPVEIPYGFKPVQYIAGCNSTRPFQEPEVTPFPNLIPYQPPNWSDKIVVSKTTGTNTDSLPLTVNDMLYLDFAAANDSNISIAEQFYHTLYVDGVEKASWISNSLPAGYYALMLDYSIGKLSKGIHQIKIVTDSMNSIKESNEQDNSYTKTITIADVGGKPMPWLPLLLDE